MSRILPALILLCIGQSVSAQYIYTIKADSVKITNSCDTAELILENHTQSVPGFLYNKGRGRTEFRRAVVKLNDSMYLIGADTLKTHIGALNGLSVNNGNVVLGQDVGQTGNPAILTGDREIPTAGYNVFTTGSGNLILGNNTNNGSKLQVNGVTSTAGIVSTTNAPLIQRFDGSWTATNNNQNNVSFEGNFTSSSVTGDRLYGYVFQPTLNVNAAAPPGQALTGVKISPNFNGTASKYALEVVGDILMPANDCSIRFSNGVLGSNDYGSYLYLRNNQGYGITFAASFCDLNAPGAIALGSQANAINEFFLGRQDVAPTTARTFALFRSPGPSTSTMFTPSSGTAKFIEIGSNSTSGAGYATFQPSSGNATYTSLSVNDYVNQTGTASGFISMLDLNMGGAIAGPLYGIRVLNPNAQSGFGVSAPTARVHIQAGSATAGTAPLKLTAGSVLSTPEDGAIEYDGTNYYITQGSTRYKLTKTLSGQITTNFGGPSLSAFNSVTTSLTVQGAAVGDVVNVSANSGSVNPPSISITAYVTSSNTVTLQAYNASNSTVTIASDTYKVSVVK